MPKMKHGAYNINQLAKMYGYDILSLALDGYSCLVVPHDKRIDGEFHVECAEALFVIAPDGDYNTLYQRLYSAIHNKVRQRTQEVAEVAADLETTSGLSMTPAILSGWPFAHCQTETYDHPEPEQHQDVQSDQSLVDVVKMGADPAELARQVIGEDVATDLLNQQVEAASVREHLRRELDAASKARQDIAEKLAQAEVVMTKAEDFLLALQQHHIGTTQKVPDSPYAYYVFMLPQELATTLRNVLFEIERYRDPYARFEEMGG